MRTQRIPKSGSTTPRRDRPARSFTPALNPGGVRVARDGVRCACGGACPRCRDTSPLQTKLAVSQSGDAHEREADQLAEQVMHMSSVPAPPAQTEEPSIQTKRSPPAPGTSLPAQVPYLRDVGQPLAKTERAFFEPRMGQDFGDVRVHTGTRAEAAAQSVNARAFTVGNDVVFNRGEYAPRSDTGKRLLAHELAHTIQQRENSHARHIQRTISVDSPTSTTSPHTQNNGALVVSLFNQLCPDITWQLNGGNVESTNTTDCDPTTVQQGTTPTACACVCNFTNSAGPHVNIEINQTDDDTVSTGTNPDSFRVRLTGQAASGIRGIQGNAPASGTPLQNVSDPAWLILGHELCGHANTTIPLNRTSPATLFHQMSQNWDSTAVDTENRIRQEHNAARGVGLGIRVGEFEDVDGNIHAGSLVQLPSAMSLASLMQELSVPVRYTFLRCVRQDFFLPCTTIPTADADMRRVRIVNRVTITDNGNQAVPFSCANNSFPQGTHFNIEGVFWHRSVSGETKQDVANQWSVTISALNRANAVFSNGVNLLPASQALTAGTMVVIPYKSAPGSSRYFLTPYTGPC